ncbi:MAG: type I restriction enzyme HsdR N-terminal domain-containing protein [Bacteroidales bacterium]|nr:type I restriction enzyme HsdR N-terminal domain-containing protein [Bacteroidales bacterium]
MLQTRENTDGSKDVFDIVRHRWVACSPEELVRQHVIMALHNDFGYPLELMQVEAKITLNGMTRRCDIVVYDRKVQPWMIVECKKQGVALSQRVVDQACRYNLVLRVPFLLLANGVNSICLKVDSDAGVLQRTGIPEFPQL